MAKKTPISCLRFDENETAMAMAFEAYRTRLYDMLIASIEWTDAPLSVNQRYLEMTLAERGGVCFFHDELLGYLALPFACDSQLNVYNEPASVRPYSVTGYQAQRTPGKDCVIIWNNPSHKPTAQLLERYAYRMADYDLSMDVNARAQKTPIYIECSEKEKASIERLIRDYNGNKAVIIGVSGTDLNRATAISTGAPFVSDKLHSLKNDIWDEAMDMLGITNVTEHKRERLIVSEVEASNGGTLGCREARMKSRRDAAKEIKRIFGLDITPTFFQQRLEDEAREKSIEVQNQVAMAKQSMANTQEKEGENDER